MEAYFKTVAINLLIGSDATTSAQHTALATSSIAFEAQEALKIGKWLLEATKRAVSRTKNAAKESLDEAKIWRQNLLPRPVRAARMPKV